MRALRGRFTVVHARGATAGLLVVALGTLAAMSSVLPAVADHEEPGGAAFCDYVESGDPGPPGNLLAITLAGADSGLEFGDVPRLSVAGDGTIRLRSATARVDCAGEVPTVTNVDSIRVVIAGAELPFLVDLAGRPFGPGVTPEPGGGSEIEIAIFAGGYGSVLVRGGPGPNRFSLMPVGEEGQSGINLNPMADGTRDVDVTAGPDVSVGIMGGGGSDSLSTLADDRAFFGPAIAIGGPGNDRLTVAGFGAALGGRGRDVMRVVGGKSQRFGGLLLGFGGRDVLLGAAARDLLFGGSGHDELRAGAGRDYVLARDGRRDRVTCGPGKDRLVSYDLGDGHRSCENRRRGERGGPFEPVTVEIDKSVARELQRLRPLVSE
jgi:Ca2+-binding RTX toxin-like protein